jgi:hypothetical protein
MRGFYLPPRPVHGGSGRHGRATSPPLEKDEKEFTQTADGLQRRKLNGDLLSLSSAPPPPPPVEQTVSMDLERDEGSLFGGSVSTMTLVSSPAIRPYSLSLHFGKRDAEAEGWAKLEGMLEWDRSPESIELEELDGLLDDY